MVVTATIVLFVSFFVMLLAGVPISAGIGIASVIAICASGRSDFQGFAFTAAQKCFSGLDSFSLLALPFFSRLPGRYQRPCQHVLRRGVRLLGCRYLRHGFHPLPPGSG